MFLHEPGCHEPLSVWQAYRHSLRYYDPEHPVVAAALLRADAEIERRKASFEAVQPILTLMMPAVNDPLPVWDEYDHGEKAAANDNAALARGWRARPRLVDAIKES